MKKKYYLIVLMTLISIFLIGCSSNNESESSVADDSSAKNEESVVLRLGHQAPAGTAYDMLANLYKEYIEERTDGRYTIEIYSGGSLGGDRELIEGMQVGNIDLSVITASDMGMFVPEMEVQDLPYLFNSWDEVYSFLESDVAEDFYALSEEADVYTLSYMPRGFRHTTNNEGPIEKPEDLNGMKIRVAESSIYVDTFQALGANTQAMAWGEVYTALQQGTIDGHENTIVTIADYQIQEVQDYLSETGHMFGFAAISASPKLIEKLTEEDYEIFKQAAIDAGIDGGKQTQEDEAGAAQKLKDDGMKFNEVDTQAFVNLMDPVYEKYFENHSREWFDAIKETAQN